MELSIIIFCYNEEENIAHVIQQAINLLSLPRYHHSEIIVVNDGSTDNTKNIVELFIGKFPHLQIINSPNNLGIGNALNKGYDAATKEFVCAIPGDGQFDIFEIDSVSDFRKDEFVTFYRKEKNYNLYRSSLTHFNQLFNKYILRIDVPDVNWIKIYRKEQVTKEFRTLNSSLVESEICGKLIKSGNRHIDYPSIYLNRKHGEAKGGNWYTLKKAIAELFQLFIVIKRFPSR